MQQTSIDTYNTSLISLLGINKVADNTSAIQTQIDAIATNRTNVIEEQNATESNNYTIQLIQDETYNSIVRFGSLARCYYDYSNKIANAADIDKPTHIASQQALRNTLNTELANNSFGCYLKCLLKFISENPQC